MFSLSRHAQNTMAAKGISADDVQQALRAGVVTDVQRYPGQKRYARGSVAVVADPVAGRVITVYRNVVETDQRPDQKDPEAQQHFSNRAERERKRRERAARDRAFTAQQKNKKG